MGCILAVVHSYLSLWKGFRWVHEAECTSPYADGARSCVRLNVRQERRAVAKYSVGLLEEELKNKVAADWFAAYDTTRIIGKVDFCVAIPATELGLFDAENAL